MSNQQAINEALDKLEIENEEVITDEVIEDEEVVDQEEQEEEVEAVNPPGYIDNIDDWVAAGKNPKLFKNPEMYSAEYDRIKDNKRQTELMETMVEGMNEWKQQQAQATAEKVEQAKANILAEIEQAKEDVDVDRAIEAQKKLNDLDKPPQQARQNPPHPTMVDFFSKNPILDSNSPQFDQAVFQDAAGFHDTLLNELTGGKVEVVNGLNPDQRVRILKAALTKAKTMNPDKFVSPRNSRKAAPAPSRKKVQQATDYASRLKSVKSNSRNVRDTTAANDTYNDLKAKAEAIKNPTAKAKALLAVEQYAKNVLGE